MKRKLALVIAMLAFASVQDADAFGYIRRGNVIQYTASIEPGMYELYGTSPNGAPYRGTASINRIGTDQYAIKWCMGRMYFGQGRVLGSQLVVQWGGNYPVVYAVYGNRLDGVWANGNATDILTLRRIEAEADCEREQL